MRRLLSPRPDRPLERLRSPAAADSAAPAAELPDTDPNAFRAEQHEEERAYAGEWAAEACNNQREIWTIEQTRMGMKRERFCHFERMTSPPATKARSGRPARAAWPRGAPATTLFSSA